MITRALMERSRLHVRRFFSKHMPRRMRFHDLEHTLTVVAAARSIGRGSGLATEVLLQVEMAALFHDTGYAVAYDGHEAESAQIARSWLQASGVDGRTVRAVAALIMATRMGHVPRTMAQRVIRDADSAKAGQADFQEKSVRLRAERQACLGKPIGKAAWLQENLAYLRGHRFHTVFAEKRFGRQKAINLSILEEQSRTGRARSAGPGTVHEATFMDRDLSWLAFNARVLQEAQDPKVPLLERLKFVAIHSSNLDEFYRVRVAQLRSLRKLGKWNRSALEVPPDKHIARINQAALKQQAALGKVYRNSLIPALRKKGIRFRNEKQLTRSQRDFVMEYFGRAVLPLLDPVELRGPQAIFIEDRKLYLIISPARGSGGKPRPVLVNVPTAELGRFILLPSRKGCTDLMYLEDAIRLGAPALFKGKSVKGCHAIKLSRDADLYLEEEFADDVADKVRKSLRKRKTGVPARFLYDGSMPRMLLAQVRQALKVKKTDMLEGGRYHNLSDLLSLPISAHEALKDEPLPPLKHPALRRRDPFRALQAGDVLLHFPYHRFSQVTDLIKYAANDREVRRIAITLYRVAPASEVCEALMEAARNGKQVDVVMEVLARFDEGNNLHWASLLTKAGAHVSYGVPGYKVHAKLLLVERGKPKQMQRYALLGTGNFNEQTAGTYSDMGLLTARSSMVTDVAEIFSKLMKGEPPGPTKDISTSPDHFRAFLEQAIDREIEQAFLGKPASILLKLNSLEDKPLIRKLYDADRAGVKVRLIVRGICCLKTGVRGQSKGTEAISIVDRFLEHARAYVFHNGGKPTVYLASADWMERNLDRRVETAFPVLHEKLKEEVVQFLELQWADNVKARALDAGQTNKYRKAPRNAKRIRSQPEWYRVLQAAGQ